MKKYIILSIVSILVVLLLYFIYSIKSFDDIQKENKLNEETQNNLYQALINSDIDSINKILYDTKFYFDKRVYTYEDTVKLNIIEFLKDDSKYIDIRKINFSASNMHYERPLHFIVWNSNNIDDMSGFYGVKVLNKYRKDMRTRPKGVGFA